jgi:VWFA-related protein
VSAIRAAAVLASLIAAGTVLRLAAQTTPPVRSGQTFRTGADVVFVDVSVRDGGRPVTGLRAEDFTLTDNGVRQRIESVEATAVPIDLTLVVDVSGNPNRPWMASRTPPTAIARAVEREIADVTRLLRPEDRVRLLAIDSYVQQAWPWSPAQARPPLGRVASDGLAAAYDTLAAALLQPVEPARRHVVVASTKGRDTISAVEADAVRAIAERSDALLHLVVLESAKESEAALSAFQCFAMGFCTSTNRFWVPFERWLVHPYEGRPLRPDGVALLAGAESTGGGLHRPAGLAEPTLAGTFKRAFDDFRSGYVLRYSPEGVPRTGWHTIDVRVPKSRGSTVRARKGYGIEETTPASRPAPAAREPRTLPELTAAYGEGRYEAVTAALRASSDPVRLLREFAEGGNPWPATPRREAAFAIELAEPAAFAARAETRDAAVEALARFSRLIRHPIEPDAFERYWHFAVLAMLEGTVRPAATRAFVERALARFPDEPRFVLSRAIVAEQDLLAPRRAAPGSPAPPPPADFETVRRHYDAAIALAEVAVEARVRLAFLLHRRGRHADALTHLQSAGAQPIAEPALAYLHQLFLGHVLAALERRDDAAGAYRRALQIRPTAQSARVALMNTLLAGGDRKGAGALAEQVETEESAALDPWWMYWQGHYRMYPQAMVKLREFVR